MDKERGRRQRTREMAARPLGLEKGRRTSNSGRRPAKWPFELRSGAACIVARRRARVTACEVRRDSASYGGEKRAAVDWWQRSR